MTHIDNTKVFYEGAYADVTVLVAANTTYVEGTVLGRNSDGKLTAYSTDLNSDNFKSEPLYILAQDLINSTNSAVEKTLVRVFDGGVVDAAKIVLVKAADKTNATYDALKKIGFRLENVEKLVENLSV